MAFGRLERTRAAPPMSDINITPLVDVMLVLVVIFILAAPLLASSIRLELPRTDGAGAHAAPPQSVTVVVVDKAGQAFINDEPLAQPALAQRFIALAAAQPATEVQLRADAAVPYGRVVAIMGAAHQAGLTRIGFVAEPVAAPPP